MPIRFVATIGELSIRAFSLEARIALLAGRELVGDKPSKSMVSFAWGIIPFGSEDIAMLPGNLVTQLMRGGELS